MIWNRPISIRCFTVVLLVAIFASAQIAHAEVSEAEKIRRDLVVLVHGDWNGQRAAVDRLVRRGSAAVPEVAALLSSEEAVARGRAAQTLCQFPADEVAPVFPQLLDALLVEPDGWAIGCIAQAAAVISEDDAPVAEVLVSRIEEGRTVGPACAQSLYDLDVDLDGAKPVLIRALSDRWDHNKCYLIWILDRKIGLAAADLVTLADVEFGPRPGNRTQDWEYTVEGIANVLRDTPDLFLRFVRSHPGALSVFRENEPWLIYLFAEAAEETQALRDYLVKREDLPAMFEINLAAGERVGVVEIVTIEAPNYFPAAVYISVIVCGDRCDVADAPLPEGYRVDFNNGLAAVNVDGLVGYTDEQGVMRIPPRFEWAGRFGNGTAWFKSGEKIGMIDTEGEVLIDPQFDGAYPLMGGLQGVVEGELHGVVNNAGDILIGPRFNTVRYDHARLCFIATTPDGTTGVIDAEGNFIPDAE